MLTRSTDGAERGSLEAESRERLVPPSISLSCSSVNGSMVIGESEAVSLRISGVDI
jgi:hypothetical protein